MARPRLLTLLLVLGDLGVFYLFVLLGLRSHERELTLWHVVRTALPFQAGWLLAGAYFGVLHPHGFALKRDSRRLALAWLAACVIGLGLRAFLFGGAIPPVFAVITFVTNLALLLTWRLIAARLLARPGALSLR